MSEMFVCGHGRVIEVGTKTPDPACVADVQTRPSAGSLTGDERALEVMLLLTDPLCVPFGVIWERVDELVGRGTFNHEMANAERLAEEARTWTHPGDANAHALTTLAEMIGDKPILVVEVNGS